MQHDSSLGAKPELYQPGGILLSALFALGCGYFYYWYFTIPQFPALQSPMVHLHVPLGVLALAAAMTAFAMALYGVLKFGHMPSVVMVLQGLTGGVFLINLVVGAYLANYTWGTYWNWDPKEIWALIIFIYVILPTSLCIALLRINWLRIALLALQLVGFLFVLSLDYWMHGLHSYGFLFIGE
jgi:ABC-type transport system involved in cytochrome c biogenesis permease subunit